MKRILSLLLLLICLAGAVFAAGSRHIIDNAGLLSESQQSRLEEQAQSIRDTYGIDAVILTVDSLSGKSAQAYADDYYDYNGYGSDGILLLLSMEERDWAVSTSGSAQSVVTNSDIDRIMDDILDDLSAGYYGSAFGTFLERVESEYEAGTSVNWGMRLLIALVIGAAVAGIALLVMRRGMNTARAQSGASNYMTEGSYDLYRCQDIYLYSHTTKTRKPESSGSGGSHTGSSGCSHGGSSGKF